MKPGEDSWVESAFQGPFKESELGVREFLSDKQWLQRGQHMLETLFVVPMVLRVAIRHHLESKVGGEVQDRPYHAVLCECQKIVEQRSFHEWHTKTNVLKLKPWNECAMNHEAIESGMRSPDLCEDHRQVISSLSKVSDAPAVDDDRVCPIAQQLRYSAVEKRLDDDVHVGVDDEIGLRGIERTLKHFGNERVSYLSSETAMVEHTPFKKRSEPDATWNGRNIFLENSREHIDPLIVTKTDRIGQRPQRHALNALRIRANWGQIRIDNVRDTGLHQAKGNGLHHRSICLMFATQATPVQLANEHHPIHSLHRVGAERG